MLQLDVLNEDIDPNVEDQFALVQIAPDFRRLFDRCVGSSPGGSVVGGFVTVGPRRVLGLSIGPRRVGKGFSEEEGGLGGNGTGLVSVVA